MIAKTPWRLLWIVLGIVAVVAVVAVAYHWGVNSAQNGIGPFMGPRRGFGMMGWSGVAWWGAIPALIVVFLVILLFAALLTGPDRGSSRPGPTSPTNPAPQVGDIDRLRDLSDLHERGRLTDEEFTAAKKKILGL